MDIKNLTPIPCTDRSKIDKLRSLIIEIQAAWLDNLFDSGLTFSNPDIFKKMQEAVCLMEQRDNVSVKGFDLKTIASDYDLLEHIFISKRWRYDEDNEKIYLDSDNFKGSELVQLHHFSPVGILKKVNEFHQSVLIAREKNLTLDELKLKLISLIDNNNLGGILTLLLENPQELIEQKDTEIISKEITHEQA